MEHDSAGEEPERMRALTSAYAPTERACNTFLALYFELEMLEQDLDLHIQLENNVLFPKALALAESL